MSQDKMNVNRDGKRQPKDVLVEHLEVT